MVDPASVPGDHNAFVCGYYDEAKHDVTRCSRASAGRATRIVDLGDIAASRGHGDVRARSGSASTAPLGGPQFNIAVSS